MVTTTLCLWADIVPPLVRGSIKQSEEAIELISAIKNVIISPQYYTVIISSIYLKYIITFNLTNNI